jgi:hypothetical protein
MFCFTIQASFAGQNSIKTIGISTVVSKGIEKTDSLLNTSISLVEVKKESDLTAETTNSSGNKICSCQILNLESSNYNHHYVVLLAEKKNDGSENAYSVAKNRINKEKKHMKQMFYDKIKVVADVHGTGSCKALFYRLKTSDISLQLYEILNADIN